MRERGFTVFTERERERCKEEKKSSEERREGKVDETVCF